MRKTEKDIDLSVSEIRIQIDHENYVYSFLFFILNISYFCLIHFWI